MTVAEARSPGRPASPDGSRTRDPKGFWWIKVAGEWVYEHREVMKALIGRPLRAGEEVRWANEDRSDNAPENLELWATVRLWPTGGHDITPGGSRDKSDGQKNGSRRETDPENLHEAHKAYRRGYVRDWRAKRRRG